MTEVVASTTPAGRAGGFSDRLPPVAGRRRALEDALLETFALWGYDYVATPLIEPLDTVARGLGSGEQNQLFRFVDSDGRLLAVIGERTVSVARVVATQLGRGRLPLRLSYSGPVLRNQALLGGRRREALQAGCELIGDPGPGADAECAALALAALRRAGLHDVQVDLGHAGFIPALLEAAAIDGAQRDAVISALAGRDLVAVEAALQGSPAAEAERRLLLGFPSLRGGPELLEAAGREVRDPRVHAVLGELRDLWGRLDALGAAGSVHIDLGAVRDFEYYTGPTFEVFSGDLGFPLGTGGRYDRLLARFGLDCPATGFVLHVDRCLDVLLGMPAPAAAEPVHIGVEADAVAAAVSLAARLRDAGVAVIIDNNLQTATVSRDAQGWRWMLGDRRGSGDEDAAVAALTGAR